MLKKLLPIGFLSALIILQSCSDEKISTPAAEAPSTDSLFTVKQAGYSFQFSVPKDIVSNQTAEIFYNEIIGVMEVRIGDGFNFYVSEEDTQLSQIKQELAEELMYKNSIIKEEGSSILYQRFLPDGQASFFQYIRIIKFGDKNYLVRTRPDAEFTLEQVEKIRKSVDSIEMN